MKLNAASELDEENMFSGHRHVMTSGKRSCGPKAMRPLNVASSPNTHYADKEGSAACYIIGKFDST